MEKKWSDITIVILIFVLTIYFGGIYINSSSHGYFESAILFLSAVIAAGCFWIGQNIKK
jgi:ABC-type thiamin/hydroxymethylpyrimidine transport system permease subunit